MGDMFSSERETNGRSVGRLPQNGRFEEMNINAYIASLTDQANSALMKLDCPASKNISVSLNKAIGMLAYLRDEYCAKTIDDVCKLFQKHQVDPEVVRKWIEEHRCVNPFPMKDIRAGYPEFRKLLLDEQSKALAHLCNKS